MNNYGLNGNQAFSMAPGGGGGGGCDGDGSCGDGQSGSVGCGH